MPADGVEEEEEDGGEQTDGVEGVLGAERASSFSRAAGSGSPSGCDMARPCGSRQRAVALGSGSGGITLRERAGEGGCGSMRRASAGHPI